MHQDILSPWLCGEGLPDWTTFLGLGLAGFNLTDPATAFPAPLPFDDVPPGPGGSPPLTADCLQHGFFLYYASFASEALWHSVYAEPEMWDAIGVRDPYRAQLLLLLSSPLEKLSYICPCVCVCVCVCRRLARFGLSRTTGPR